MKRFINPELDIVKFNEELENDIITESPGSGNTDLPFIPEED